MALPACGDGARSPVQKRFTKLTCGSACGDGARLPVQDGCTKLTCWPDPNAGGVAVALPASSDGARSPVQDRCTILTCATAGLPVLLRTWRSWCHQLAVNTKHPVKMSNSLSEESWDDVPAASVGGRCRDSQAICLREKGAVCASESWLLISTVEDPNVSSEPRA